MSISTYALVLGALLILVGFRIFLNHAKVDPYEYLGLLHPLEWRKAKKVRQKMERLKNGRISGPNFYHDMAQLEEEELIEAKTLQYPLYKVRFYRLTAKGQGKRIRESEFISTTAVLAH